ncbi:MAG: enoyl-CoA hydratase-related protein [Dehalococcoidia bacterium]
MPYDYLLYDVSERIATITLNRPEKLNALSVPLQLELVAALRAAEADAGVRVVVLKGEGRAFCAGYDLSGGLDGPRARGPMSAVDDAANLNDTLSRLLTIWDLKKPVIAQVHGFCLAGGTQLALVCDLTIAADDATFGIPQLPVGIGFVLPFWTWLIGPKRAREVFYRIGSRISAKQAYDWGMLTDIVPARDLATAVRERALAIAETPVEILLLAKRGINETQEVQGFRESLRYGVDLDALSHQSRAVRATNQLIKEEGLRAALARWRDVVDAPESGGPSPA